MDQIKQEEPDKSGDGTPVCIRCFQPVDPLVHYCSHCGEATGRFTHYIPFVNIPWQTRIWGQVWRQIWSRDVSTPRPRFPAVHGRLECPCHADRIVIQASPRTDARAAPKWDKLGQAQITKSARIFLRLRWNLDIIDS